MRQTKTRESVYDFFVNNRGQGYTPYELAEELSMNVVTVYRVLDFLQKHKLIHHVPTVSKWTLCHHQNNRQDHNFLICKKCSSIEEYITPHTCTHHFGFHCEEHVSEVLGTCRKCYLT